MGRRTDSTHLDCTCGGEFVHSDDVENKDGTITSSYCCDSCETYYFLRFEPARPHMDEEDIELEDWYDDGWEE